MARSETEVRPNWILSLRVWWAFAWRLALVTAVVGPVFNYSIVTWAQESDFLFFLILGLGATAFMVADVWVMHTLLQKRFGAYRITVMKTQPDAEPS